ncbi:hypothetical protein [Tsukamurella soli]|uniref:hypothetical protein n=1 Tax=Tsukamurella soli TaxID=644556 RepID=UPI0031EDF3B3
MTDPIEDFWAWWAGARADARRALADGAFGSLPEQLTRRLREVDEELDWEFGHIDEPGRWSLVISANGDPELRRLAEQVCAGAPADDPDFDYHPARQPDPGIVEVVMTVDGGPLALADLRFAVTVDRARHVVDVAAYHPGFGAVDESGRLAVVFMTLDKLLGEDAVERWIGEVATAADEPAGAVPPAGLADMVAEVAAGAPADGWVELLTSTPDGVPMRVGLRRPLHWLDRPLCTRLAVLERAFPAERGRGGDVPRGAVIAQLEADESELLGGPNRGASPCPLMTQTVAGKRTLILAVDPEADAAPFADWAERYEARLSFRDDPGWNMLRRYR